MIEFEQDQLNEDDSTTSVGSAASGTTDAGNDAQTTDDEPGSASG